jgi:multiple sugar transport system permease protein
MLTPALLGLVVFFVYPLIANIYYSFTSYDLLSPPAWVGLRNYQYLFTQDPSVAQATFNTLWFVVVLVPMRIIMAIAVASLLVRAKQASGFWSTRALAP